MKTKFHYLLALFSLIAIQIKAQTYKLNKVSEIRIESLSDVNLLDYYPKNDLFVGAVNQMGNPPELLIVDGKGEILKREIKEGQGPEEYLGSALTMGFSNDGEILLNTSLALYTYDFNFKLIEKLKFDPKSTMTIRPSPRSRFLKLGRSSSALSFISLPLGSTAYSSHATNNELYLIEYYNGDTKSVERILPYSSRKVYRGYENTPFPVSIDPIFTVDEQKNELYLSTSFDNEITVYNPVNWEVIRRIPVQHKSFRPLKSIPMEKVNFQSTGRYKRYPFNSKLIKFDSELLGLVYVREISEAAYELRESDGKSKYLNDPTFNSLILFKNGVQLPGELTIPSGLIQMTLPNNRVLVKVVNEEEELDYIPFEIWELVEN